MLVRLPKTFNGGLTLNILARSAEKYFSLYEYIWAPILNKLGDRSIDKSYWVQMTKDLLPGSQNKSYEEQQKIVAGLAEKSLTGYDVPGVLEAAACILSHRLDSNIRLFSDNPPIFTRCKHKVERSQISVGGSYIITSTLSTAITAMRALLPCGGSKGIYSSLLRRRLE